MKNLFKKGAVFALSAMMVLTMGAGSVFAATDDATRQANSNGTATINLEKTLTVNQANKFPNTSTFTFEMERIEAWDNANVSTATSGANIAKADIPMPAAATGIAVSGDKATVTLSDYSTATTGDTTTARSRNLDVPITYTKAGYYVYKINERLRKSIKK